MYLCHPLQNTTSLHKFCDTFQFEWSMYCAKGRSTNETLWHFWKDPGTNSNFLSDHSNGPFFLPYGIVVNWVASSRWRMSTFARLGAGVAHSRTSLTHAHRSLTHINESRATHMNEPGMSHVVPWHIWYSLTLWEWVPWHTFGACVR